MFLSKHDLGAIAQQGSPALSGGLAAAADDIGEERYGGDVGNAEPGAEVVPEGDAEFLAGLAEAEEGVAAGATEVAVGAAADLALDHLAAQRGFRVVGVQRYLGMVEHLQQLGLVGIQPLERAIECGKAGGALEARLQLAAPAPGRRQPVGFQRGVKPPDQPAHVLLARHATDQRGRQALSCLYTLTRAAAGKVKTNPVSKFFA